MKILENIESIDKFIEENQAAMLYFSSKNCSVCVGLYPKVRELLEGYDKIAFAKVEIDEVQLAVGKYSVYTAPTIIMFIESKEVIRQARLISILELQEKIERLYELI